MGPFHTGGRQRRTETREGGKRESQDLERVIDCNVGTGGRGSRDPQGKGVC